MDSAINGEIQLLGKEDSWLFVRDQKTGSVFLESYFQKKIPETLALYYTRISVETNNNLLGFIIWLYMVLGNTC